MNAERNIKKNMELEQGDKKFQQQKTYNDEVKVRIQNKYEKTRQREQLTSAIRIK